MVHLDVSKNRGTPKWMVYNGSNPIKIDDLGIPLYLETSILILANLWDRSLYPEPLAISILLVVVAHVLIPHQTRRPTDSLKLKVFT